MAYYLYIMTNQKNGTLYIGATNDLIRRTFEHREGLIRGFTKKYGLTRLVYYEAYEDVRDALEREKRMKEWKRAWKIELIERENPEWRDLWFEINQ